MDRTRTPRHCELRRRGDLVISRMIATELCAGTGSCFGRPTGPRHRLRVSCPLHEVQQSADNNHVHKHTHKHSAGDGDTSVAVADHSGLRRFAPGDAPAAVSRRRRRRALPAGPVRQRRTSQRPTGQRHNGAMAPGINEGTAVTSLSHSVTGRRPVRSLPDQAQRTGPGNDRKPAGPQARRLDRRLRSRFQKFQKQPWAVPCHRLEAPAHITSHGSRAGSLGYGPEPERRAKRMHHRRGSHRRWLARLASGAVSKIWRGVEVGLMPHSVVRCVLCGPTAIGAPKMLSRTELQGPQSWNRRTQRLEGKERVKRTHDSVEHGAAAAELLFGPVKRHAVGFRRSDARCRRQTWELRRQDVTGTSRSAVHTQGGPTGLYLTTLEPGAGRPPPQARMVLRDFSNTVKDCAV